MASRRPPSATDRRPIRRAGRPREDEREELRVRRRREIIEAAYAVFGEKGYKAAGTADIAAALGIGEGTIYRYFENKRDIVDHVVDYGVEQLVAALQEAAPVESANSIEEFADQIRLMATQVFALIEQHPRLMRVLMFEATSIDDELTHRIVGLIESFGAFSAGYFAHGIEAGFMRGDLSPEVLAPLFNSLVLPAMLRSVTGKIAAEERDEYIETMVAFACDGVRAPTTKRAKAR